jgi:hypothetical protein
MHAFERVSACETTCAAICLCTRACIMWCCGSAGSSSASTGLIIGVVVGGACLLGLAAVALVVYRQRASRQEEQKVAVRTHKYTYILTFIHTQIHTYIHTCMHDRCIQALLPSRTHFVLMQFDYPSAELLIVEHIVSVCQVRRC